MRNCPKRREATPSRNERAKKPAFVGAIEVGTLGFLTKPEVQINMISVPPDAIDEEYMDDTAQLRCERASKGEDAV